MCIRDRGYGTPMFNCINYEMIRWAIEAAEEVGMPVLIGPYFGFETTMDPAVAEMAVSYTHLDVYKRQRRK